MKRFRWFLLLLCIVIGAFSVSGQQGVVGSAKRTLVVVIDPGHGGRDPGAVSGKAEEKNIVLDISLRLGNLIQTSYPEIKVIYTRTKDIFIPLHERARLANRSKADLFISIHANYVNSANVQGAETYVLGQHRSDENLEVAKKENAVILLEDDYTSRYEGFDPNLPESYIMFELIQDEYLEQSVLLASVIQDQFRVNANRHDRSVRQAGFLVLRQVTMPAVLVEAGFLSHSAERNYLMTEKGRNEIARSIFYAFENYKRKTEEKSNFVINTQNNHKVTNTGNLTARNNITPETSNVVANHTNETKIHFSVQIAALKKSPNPTPANFKGETGIIRMVSPDYSRYYSGKFNTFYEAEKERKRLLGKFPGAFVVAFENDRQIPADQFAEKP